MSTIANPNTIGIVDLVLRNDPAVPERIRSRALALISHGTADDAVPSDLVSETTFAGILGLDQSTVSKWRRGLTPHRGPFPFTFQTNLSKRLQYSREAAIKYAGDHRDKTTVHPTPGAPT